MIQPVRIQQKRVKGFNLQQLSRSINGLPAMSVARPNAWGNPYVVVPAGHDTYNVVYKQVGSVLLIAWALSKEMAIDLALEKYEAGLNKDVVRRKLKGHNLSCYCQLNQKCHVDILIHILKEK